MRKGGGSTLKTYYSAALTQFCHVFNWKSIVSFFLRLFLMIILILLDLSYKYIYCVYVAAACYTTARGDAHDDDDDGDDEQVQRNATHKLSVYQQLQGVDYNSSNFDPS